MSAMASSPPSTSLAASIAAQRRERADARRASALANGSQAASALPSDRPPATVDMQVPAPAPTSADAEQPSNAVAVDVSDSASAASASVPAAVPAPANEERKLTAGEALRQFEEAKRAAAHEIEDLKSQVSSLRGALVRLHGGPRVNPC